MLLLVYPLSNKVLTFCGLEESKVVNFVSLKLRITSLKPLLDSFQGSFKDNMRFFAGLYFHYRWIALIINIIPSDFDKIYTVLEIFIVIILMMHALCQPYTARIHNIIDTFLFSNLALINAITFLHYYTFRTRAGKQVAMDYITTSAAIQLVLIYLPLLVIALYIITRIFRKIGQKYFKSQRSRLSLGRSYVNEDSLYGEELPHRLIAEEVDYSGFKETECTLHTTESTSVELITY